MGTAIFIVALVLVGGVIGTTLNFAGVFLAIPFLFVAVGAVLGREQMQRRKRMRQLHRFRRSAQARKFDFTEADKRTVV